MGLFSSMNRSVARSSMSFRSTVGWNWKSKSRNVRLNGKRAKRRRAASLRLMVADACSEMTLARNSIWLHSWSLASSARVAKHSADRSKTEIAEVVLQLLIERVGHDFAFSVE